METLWQDLRYGVRMLRTHRGVTAIAVLALALGIGANTAIFTVVNAVLLRPLPFSEPDRLMMVWLHNPQSQGEARIPLSVADFLDWRANNQAFEPPVAFATSGFNLTGQEAPEQLVGAIVTADFFSTLGAKPALGRTFLPEEDRPGATPAIVVSQAMWQRRLSGDPHAIGQTLTLNGRTFTIVGVMPPDFYFPNRNIELWAAFTLNPPTRRGPYFLSGLARLKPGVKLEQAQAEMKLIARRIQQQSATANANSDSGGFTVLPLNEYLVGDVRKALLVLLGAVAFVLLIASVNVANLLLARAAAREKEIAVRAALGASRVRIVRQLLTESALLALLGGTAGLLLAVGGVKLLLALSPSSLPRLQEVSMDRRVFGFTLLVALLSGIIFGLAPALHGSRANLNESLKDGSRGASESRSRSRLRQALIVAEFALALMLLIGAGLMIKSFVRLQRVNPGINAENVLTMQLTLPGARYNEGPKITAFYQQLLDRVQALPGVQAAGISISLPPDWLQLSENFSIEGQPPAPDSNLPVAELLFISHDYFRALGVPLRRGRYFTLVDKADAPRVAIINETMARRYFPNQDPIGKRIKQGGADRPQASWMEVVGVVGDVKYTGLDATAQATFYEPYLQNPSRGMYLVVRGATDPLNLASTIRHEVWALDKDLPVTRLKTMEQLLYESVAEPRFRTLLLGIFAAVALVLASVGIYGVMAYAVTQRTNEIGIRMALGAQSRDILGLVVGQGLKLALIGVALGLAGAFAVTRALSTLLYGVSTTDAATFAGLALLLVAVALLACYIPARRAAKVDPMLALRCE